MNYYKNTRDKLLTNPNINLEIVKRKIELIKNFEGDIEEFQECFFKSSFDIDTKEWFYWFDLVRLIRKTAMIKVHVQPQDTRLDNLDEEIMYILDNLGIDQILFVRRDFRIYRFNIFIPKLKLS